MVAAIEIQNVSKRYRRGWRRSLVAAVDDVSLSIEKGEALGFIGPNGAGKSTTIRMLLGITQPSAGSVSINGIPALDPRARLGLAYVPENPYLQDYLTPLEVLTVGVRFHRLALPDMTAHCMAWLEKFGLEKAATRKIRTFSKGMVQRTALAHALAVRPSVLVLDEPLSGLDPIGRREVVDILAEYRLSGGTLFFSSHVLHDVERLADRYALIHQGKLRAVRSPAELVGADDRVTILSQGGQGLPGQVAETGGRWSWECSRADIWPALDALRGAGQSVLEMKPRLSLEAAFLAAIGKDANEGA